MKLYKAAALAALALATSAILAGCQVQSTPYETNNSEGYTVSVRYDGNGGTTQSGSVALVDCFNVADMTATSGDQAQIALLSPENEARGNDKLQLSKEDHFLVGWYRERHESTDENGNVTYTYSDKWDFETDKLTVSTDGSYDAEEPVMTLYAAWAPVFQFDFYAVGSDDKIGSYEFNPNEMTELSVPKWDEESGSIKMYKFPEKKGYTFANAYYDADGKDPVKTESIVHNGVIDYETGTVQNTVMSLYTEWTEGEWYHIYTAEQFKDNASLSGCYEIMADLDFADEIWPTSLMYGNFEGQIRGNGHTIKNVNLEQTNNSKTNAGLFGNVTEKASITDVTFENVCFTIKKGTRVKDTSFGLFAGRIAQDATVKNVKIVKSVLQIDSKAQLQQNTGYTIGLVCGTGDATVISKADITCKATGDNADALKIRVDGNAVTLEE